MINHINYYEYNERSNLVSNFADVMSFPEESSSNNIWLNT